MENATILTPPSTGLSGSLLSVRTQYSLSPDIIQLLGHCITMWYAMYQSLVKLTKIGTSWGDPRG